MRSLILAIVATAILAAPAIAQDANKAPDQPPRDSYYRKGADVPAKSEVRTSVAKGNQNQRGSELQVSDTPCTLSTGASGLVVKVLATGEMRCARLNTR